MKPDRHTDRQDEGFAGTLKNIQLNDLIQMCCLSAVTLAIRVSKAQKHGTIYIQDGQIVHAEFDGISGEEAFYIILSWGSGVFETLDAGPVSTVTIHKGYQFLLMEAAHQADERDHRKDAEAAQDKSELAEPTKDKLGVLVVDDSPMMSKILSSMLNADERLRVVGIAENGERALNLLDELKPDLITMDINMPVMNGSTALKHIMIKSPCPVVIMSNIGDGGHQAIIEFLNLGAVDFMSKPVQNRNIVLQQQKIVERVNQAAGAKIKNFKRNRAPKIARKEMRVSANQSPSDSLVIICAGAGGHSVMLDVLARLPQDYQGSLVGLQAIPPMLLSTMAEYLDERCQIRILPLENGSELNRGWCHFGTYGRHLRVVAEKEQRRLKMEDGQPANENHSLVDAFLISASDVFAASLTVVLLSGSIVDSQQGLRAVKQKKGRIIIQERTSCMIPAPLTCVAEQGLVDGELEAEEIARRIMDGH